MLDDEELAPPQLASCHAGAPTDPHARPDGGPVSPLTAVPRERFRRIASAAVWSIGADRAHGEELERELVDHLTDAWERASAMGLAPEVAERRAIAAFGDPEAIRRQFVARRMVGDARSAIQLPLACWLVIAVDTSAAWIALASPQHDVSASWLAQALAALSYFVRSGMILWIGHAGFRLGGRLCNHALSGRSTGATALAGVGVALAALGLLLALGPGMAFPMLRDAIDRALGERSLMALTALATGSSVALAGMLRDLVGPSAANRQG